MRKRLIIRNADGYLSKKSKMKKIMEIDSSLRVRTEMKKKKKRSDRLGGAKCMQFSLALRSRLFIVMRRETETFVCYSCACLTRS